MRNFKVLVFVVFMFGCLGSEGQSWVWGKEAVPHSIYSGGDAPADHGAAVDKTGNVYIVGEYWDTISFGSDTLNGRGGIYIAKYNSNGNFLWAENTSNYGNFNGPGASSVAIDKKSNVYVAGGYIDTIHFGTYVLTTNNYEGNIFLAKYDSNGNILWAKQAVLPSAKSSGFIYSLCMDDLGNPCAIGIFRDTIILGTDTLISKNGAQGSAFLVKYNSNGNVIWARQGVVPSSKSWGYGRSIAIDRWNNIYITGSFKDSILFGSSELITTNNAFDDAFITKYDSGGNVIWAKQSESLSYGEAWSISIDGNSDIYITGVYQNKIWFATDTLKGGNDWVFIVKYDTDGTVLWAEQGIDLNANSAWYGYSLSSDTTSIGGGYLIINATANAASHYYFKLKFENDTLYLSTTHQVASALIHFDSSGKVLCSSIFTEGNEDDGDAVGVDKSGKYVYYAGDWSDDTNMVFGIDTFFASNDIPFVARWQPCPDTNITTSTPPISNTPSLSLFPNPNTGAFTIAFVGAQHFVPTTIEIYNMMGQKVFSKSYQPSANNYQLDLGSNPSGVYLYRVIDESGVLVGEGKFVIQK